MLLLIPGPVATRPQVRAAMTQDFAPWDASFRPLYTDVRERIAALADALDGTHTVLPLQGCGHFAVEAAIRSLVPSAGRLLIPMTGSYADRMARLARECGKDVTEMPVPAGRPVQPDLVGKALAADQTVTHVGLVYSETSSGIVHDARAIGEAVRASGRRLILDAVSAFGALPINLAAQPEVDALIFTANKCLEGMPGLSFIVARIDRLDMKKGHAGSWSFDLSDIHAHAGSGSFRFTPPAQVLAALRTALHFHDAEGGQPARLARYRDNTEVLYSGMQNIGLRPYLSRDVQGPIVLNVHAPADESWSLPAFVDALKRRGFLISDFYNTAAPSFRVGCIGAVVPADMTRFVAAVDSALNELGVRQRTLEPASAIAD